MRRQTRTAVAIATTIVAAAAMTGCSSDGGDAGSTDSAGTVNLWVRDYQKSIMQPLADAYNKTHDTQVKVTLVPAADFVQKLGTAVAAGNGPDAASIDLVFDPYFASAGALADISDRVTELPYLDDMSPAHLAQAEYDGATYAVPFTGDVSVLFYNKALFEQAGLDPETPPANFADVKAASAAVTALGGDTKGYVFSGACGGCNIFSLTPYIWASGGNVLNDDGTEALLDTPEVTEGLNLYREMWKAGEMPELAQTDNGPNAGTPFLAGTVGMRADGTGFLGALVADGTVDFGVTPIPGVDGDSASFAGGDNLSIMASAKNEDGAWDFIKWATDEEAQTILAEKAVLPVRMDLLSEIYVPLDPRYQVFADALAVGKVPYSVVENELFNDNNGVWATLIQESVFGDGSIEDAQAKAQKEAQAILDDAN
jgi:multiple sugar transport system substrate-binding protein